MTEVCEKLKIKLEWCRQPTHCLFCQSVTNDSTLVVNAIHGVLQKGYFFSIYILENVSSLSIMILATSDLTVCMNC